MKTTIQTAKEYNEQTENPVMRFRTESGKDRQTGFVVRFIGGSVQWFPNLMLAKKEAKENPEGKSHSIMTPQDFNA